MDHLMAVAIRLVSGKWKIALLSHLTQGPIRYGKLHRLLPQMSTKVFTQQLRALERDGLICRSQASEASKWVEYSITSHGAELWNSLQLLGKWAENFYTQGNAQDHRGGASRKRKSPALNHALRGHYSAQRPQTPARHDPTVYAPNTMDSQMHVPPALRQQIRGHLVGGGGLVRHSNIRLPSKSYPSTGSNGN
jgi:DNA-binding HxlR family transcriptional regulator